jgi:hypothetical protein
MGCHAAYKVSSTLGYCADGHYRLLVRAAIPLLWYRQYEVGLSLRRYFLARRHYFDVPLFDETYYRNDRVYVPFHKISVAAGPFLPPSFDSIEQHLELPSKHEFSHNIRAGIEIYRRLGFTEIR